MLLSEYETLNDEPGVSAAMVILSPGNNDDVEDRRCGWSDIDDEGFEDITADEDDYHEM